MAGTAYSRSSTYKVNDASGVLPDRFVEDIASDDGKTMEIQAVSGANVDCVGVCHETKADGLYAAVYDIPGDVVMVDYTGTLAVGDRVYNNSDGKAVKVPVTGTPLLFWSQGRVMEINSTDYKIKMRIEKIQISS